VVEEILEILFHIQNVFNKNVFHMKVDKITIKIVRSCIPDWLCKEDNYMYTFLINIYHVFLRQVLIDDTK
jgi:hypothetical protein